MTTHSCDAQREIDHTIFPMMEGATEWTCICGHRYARSEQGEWVWVGQSLQSPQAPAGVRRRVVADGPTLPEDWGPGDPAMGERAAVNRHE